MMPAEPDIPPSMATLTNGTIRARYPETFSLDAVLDRATGGAAAGGSLLSISIRDNATWITCNHSGTGSLSTIFNNDSTASYAVACRPVVAITLAMGVPFPLDLALQASEGRDVQYISQSDGLIENGTEEGHITITCVEEGRGTLWVFFVSGIDDTYYNGSVDYYDLTCEPHDQGGG
jgi:hypothetical protein